MVRRSRKNMWEYTCNRQCTIHLLCCASKNWPAKLAWFPTVQRCRENATPSVCESKKSATEKLTRWFPAELAWFLAVQSQGVMLLYLLACFKFSMSQTLGAENEISCYWIRAPLHRRCIVQGVNSKQARGYFLCSFFCIGASLPLKGWWDAQPHTQLCWQSPDAPQGTRGAL